MSRPIKAPAKVGALLIKVVLPFFVKHVWPLIQDEVAAILKRSIEYIGRTFKETVDRRTQFREQEARVRVEEAEQRMAEARTDVDIARYRAEADVWRQVAESLKRDNERLQQELTATLHATAQKFEQEMRAVSIEVTHNQAQLKAGDRIIPLPSPSDPS